MSEIEIKKITVKVLEIPEASSTTESRVVPPAVSVTLKKGELAYPCALFYLGIMTWKDAKGVGQAIDMVQAVFSGAGEGSVKLKIELTDGNKFNSETPVSLVPVAHPTATDQDLKCIKIEPFDASDLTVLTISFLAPREYEVVTYPTVYFLTDDGIIDPGLGAMRIPP